MSQFAGATLSPSTYDGPLPTQNTAALIEMPAFTQFLTGLWAHGRIILLVNITDMMPHRFQREVNLEHVNKLAQSIQNNNMSYLHPMKGSTSYNWDDLSTLGPLTIAPVGIQVNIFDGGHRLAAVKSLGNEITQWPVELFPEGKYANPWHLHGVLRKSKTQLVDHL